MLLTKAEVLRRKELFKGIQKLLKEDPNKLREIFTYEQVKNLETDWAVLARPEQLECFVPIDTWTTWVVLAGRGFGKTLTASQWVLDQVVSGNMRSIAIVGRTPGEAEKIMIYGLSGIIARAPLDQKPIYNANAKKLTFPNGAVCYVYSSEVPDAIRGTQHDGFVMDEFASYRFIDGDNGVWSNMKLTMRLYPLDKRPRGLITTTPRPLPIIKAWVEEHEEDMWIRSCQKAWGQRKKTDSGLPMGRPWADVVSSLKQRTRLGPNEEKLLFYLDRRYKRTGSMEVRPLNLTYVTRGSTFANIANWPDSALNEIIQRYQGTRLAKQELMGDILEDSNESLWKSEDLLRCQLAGGLPRVFRHIVVGVDPQKKAYGAARKKKNDETGIVVAGLTYDGLMIVLDDRTVDGSPEEWARAVVQAANDWHAHEIVAETNTGGDMVRAVLSAVATSSQLFMPTLVDVTATKNKKIRAEPVVVLYARGIVKHYGHFSELEKQQVSWSPLTDPESPDRVDALVHALTRLNEIKALDDGDKAIIGYR